MKSVIFFLVVFALAFVIYVRWLEKTSVFYPSQALDATPADAGLPYEDVHFKTADRLSLHGWFVKAPGATTTLLFLHGNAGNISGRLDKIVLFQALGLNVLIIDYRGYGKSQGVPSEQGLYKDAVAAFDYLLSRDDVRHKRIAVYGESLGGVAAIDLATQRGVAALIIDSTFSTAADMARIMYPFVPTFLIKTKMDSLSKINTVPIPKLFLHSPDDATVPFSLGKKLFDKAVDPKKFIMLKGAHSNGHVDSKEIFVKGIKDFLIEWGLI